jgi:hypothetical protein
MPYSLVLKDPKFQENGSKDWHGRVKHDGKKRGL